MDLPMPSNEHHANLLAKIAARQSRVGIIGLGYVGLPLAQAFVTQGFSVLGFDTDPDKLNRLQTCESYLAHIPASTIRMMHSRGFEATGRCKRLWEADAILICVPTPLTPSRDPDLNAVAEAGRTVAGQLHSGQLIVLESTSYPGTTREVVLPILEATGLRAGQDFFLAYSPEREDPGNGMYSLTNTPKVVGGFDPASQQLAAALYGPIVERVVRVGSLEVAEGCKILENTYRAVNIALVNELKVLFDRMGINIWEVIDAAKTKPFGFQAFAPGPGLGGHCIPIDPFYLSWLARRHGLSTRFIELAGEVNTAMPAYVMSKIADALNDRCKPVRGSRILLLGVAYKKDVDDVRESPALELLKLLEAKGAQVSYNDPYVPEVASSPHRRTGLQRSQPLTAEYLQSQDCVVIVTDHSAYDWAWVIAHSSVVVDSRNATREVVSHRDRIVLA